jgi:hypothetical protein
MKRLEKLTAKNNKLRRKTKAKKIKGGSFSSEEENSSNEEDVSKKGKKGRNNHDNPSYNSMSFNYDNMASTTAYTSIPLAKPPILMELVIINGNFVRKIIYILSHLRYDKLFMMV